ncbi:ribonuclease H-like domain-containing protein, partial [Tanacetum coccineum]
EVLQTSDGLCLNQKKYCMELLSEYGMLACKPAKAPNPDQSKKKKDKVEPEIDFFRCLSQFMLAPCQSHLKLSFHVLRYLKSSPRTGNDEKHMKAYRLVGSAEMGYINVMVATAGLCRVSPTPVAGID